MTLKKKLLISIAALTGILGIVLLFLGENVYPIVFLGFFLLFLIYALWNPPSKHKSFSFSDQQKATARALGGSGPPELPTPKNYKKIKKKK